MNMDERVAEIAEFLGVPLAEVKTRMNNGFFYNHAKVAEDFNRLKPQNDEELLTWYRSSDTYIYELSNYHGAWPGDPDFNYSGMCDGIAEYLANMGKSHVLCMGDGVGDLTIALCKAGQLPTYHDLAGSKTAGFAQFLFAKAGVKPALYLTSSWSPNFPSNSYDAVVALDFFEHLPDVEAWARAVVNTLRPGGVFLAQNAFSIGSGEDGSIPMHLASNDHWTQDWPTLLTDIGLTDLQNGWWQKP